MTTDKQQRIDKMLENISEQICMLEQRKSILDDRKNILNRVANELDDPHALIPNSAKSVEDWLYGHPFPNAVLSNICRNKNEAYRLSLFSHTTMYEYHIVKCDSVEYYRNKFNIEKDGY